MDTAAIRKVVTDVERLQNDLEGFTALLTEDATIVNFGGRRVPGRDNIYEAMKQALETPLADVRTTNEIEDIRFIRPDVAIASCIKHVSDQRDPDTNDPLPAERGRLTLVLVNESGKWLVSSLQTTPIRT